MKYNIKDNFHFFIFVSIFLAVIFLTSCRTGPKLSPMQKRQLTTKMFRCNYENAYRATLTVLQDQGYVVKNTDMDSGLIVANVDRATSGGSKVAQALLFGYVPNKGTEVEVSCLVNKLSNTSSEVRINIQEVKYGQSSFFSGTGKQNSKQIYEPQLYYSLFNEILVEIKRREAMEGMTSEPEIKSSNDKASIRQKDEVNSRAKRKIRVMVDKADIMLKADENSKIIKTVGLGTTFEYSSKVDDWYLVNFLGKNRQFTISGYIHKICVQDINETSETDKINKNVIIYLKDGTVIKAIIISQNEQTVIVETSLGKLTINRYKIRKIESDK